MLAVRQQPVRIPAGRAVLDADLCVPDDARGLVVFAHGSGSSRHSPRNRRVAWTLQNARLATLLLDLLDPAEEAYDQSTAELRFDVGLLAGRLLHAERFARRLPEARGLKLGFFGASTGAAAALIAASDEAKVDAVVSRGGRPDLAGDRLCHVLAPTLLIVGGEDHPDVLRWNREALACLHGVRELEIVPGASHLFEEPGALDAVAELARDWFADFLA